VESIKWKANLKWPRLKLLFFFYFWEFFSLGMPPMRIRPPEKSLCFSTIFESVFEPSIIIFRAPSSPHLISSAPLSPWPSKVVCFLTLPLFWVRLQALTSFERDFELSIPFERAFEPSTILLIASSSLHFPFSFYLGRSPITMRPFFFFYLGRSLITMRPFSLYLSKNKKQFPCLILHQAGRLE
jgi:hypothetical protein